MAKAPSNRERIEKLALEAELSAKEKSGKKSAPATAGRKRAPSKTPASAGERMKLVWKVFDPAHKEVATFPYPQKALAEAKASQRSDATGKPFVVRGVKVAMDED